MDAGRKKIAHGRRPALIPLSCFGQELRRAPPSGNFEISSFQLTRVSRMLINRNLNFI